MSAIIQGNDLVKRYGSVTAVAGIDFAVQEGECFGFLGPNGAGKTTTIRMITCISPLTGGSLIVDGLDVRTSARHIKARLGVVPQDDNLDPDLTIEKNLAVYARYFDIPSHVAARRIDEVLALFQLTERRKEVVDALSGGMKRRLAIARALINEPRILILDEPTTGLDPQARHLVWQKLRLLKSQGTTMLLTTHYMEEAARLCDRLVVMHLGRILDRGTPQELILRHAGEWVAELHLPEHEREPAVALINGHNGLRTEEVEDLTYVFGLTDPRHPILERISPGGQNLLVRSATLEDVFLRLTGRGLQE